MKQILTGIIFFGIITSLICFIIPDGKMKKTSAKALSFIMSFFLVSFFISFNVKEITGEEKTYVYTEKENQEYLIKFACNKILKNNGIFVKEILVETLEDNFIFYISTIKIVNPTDENGNSAGEKVVEIICQYFNVEKEKVIVYE